MSELFYPASSEVLWSWRVVAKVEWHPGELYPRVAAMESYFGTMKTELIHQVRYPPPGAAQRNLFADAA